MSYDLTWPEIRTVLKKILSDFETNIVLEKHQTESFGSGYIVYRVGGKLLGVNFDRRNEQVFVLESDSPIFDFRTCNWPETICLWELPDKATALQKIGEVVKPYFRQ